MKISLLCTALLLCPAVAMAGVNTKNGNFYITYTDISEGTGAHPLELTRTYNSKTSGKGWFGFGWGSTFETNVVVMPDGSVVVHENGFGQENYYAPQEAGGLQAGVDKIVAVAIQRDKLSAEAAQALRSKLLANEDQRRSSVAKYAIKTELPMGVSAVANSCAAVTRIVEGYQRTSCGGGIDYFDPAGHLIRQENEGYSVSIHYAGNYPDKIEDTLGQKLFLMWTPAGHIAEARTEREDSIARYYYDERENLNLEHQVSGNYYKYQYDSNHNLTTIVYADGSHMDMQYDDKSLITSVTETDGAKATYSYRSDPANPDAHYWTKVTRTSVDGEQTSREDEFNLATDAAGVEHLAALRRTEGDSKKDMEWDKQGRIKRVQKPDGGFAEYFYHPTLNKVSAVITNEVSTVFSYNKKGDLARAYNTHGQLITLGYDGKKRIIRMTETNPQEHGRRILNFKYNAQGKPIVIRLIGKGEIRVTYDAQGEVDKVESKQGVAMALGVTQAFQTLLQVVKVAGVDM